MREVASACIYKWTRRCVDALIINLNPIAIDCQVYSLSFEVLLFQICLVNLHSYLNMSSLHGSYKAI